MTRRLVLLSVLIGIFQITAIILTHKTIPPEVPLFYSLRWGQSQLVNSFFLFLLPGISLIMLLLNLVISFIFFDKEKRDYFLVRTMIVFSFIIFVVSSFGLWKIISLFL